GGLDLPAAIALAGVRFAVRPAKHCAAAVGECLDFSEHARVQRNAAIVAVLGLEETHFAQCPVNLTPIEIQRLRKAGACVEKKNDQRSQMLRALPDKPVSFGRCEAPD